MTATAEALRAAKRGWKVFPITAGAKMPPHISDWENNATSDPEKIKSWSAMWPGCNFGLACGPSGLCVVDVDEKPGKVGGETLDALELEHGDMPATLVASTPSGGRHIYLDGVHPTSQNKLGRHIDTRSRGGYVLLPGSVVDGNPYAWKAVAPIAPCPDWVVSSLGRIMEKDERRDVPAVELDQPSAVVRATAYLRTAEPSLEGEGGDDNAYRVACKVRDMGVSEDMAAGLMLELWNDRCQPPWDSEDLERKIQNAYRYARGQAGASSPDADFDDDLPIAPDQAPQGDPDLFKWTCFADVDPRAIPPRKWVLGYRYLSGFITLTISPGGVGKSTLTMLELVSIASGLPLSGDKVHINGPVWIYNTEDPGDELHRRLAAIWRHFPELTDDHKKNVFATSGHESPLVLVKDSKAGLQINKKGVAEIIRRVRDAGIVAIAVDPFVRAHAVNENDNMAIDKVVQCFTRIAAETGVAVGLVHHTNKGKEGSGVGDMNKARGASSLVNAARVAHTLTAMGEMDARVYGVPARERWQYMRLDDAKANLAPPTGRERWFQKVNVILENAAGGIEADRVAVAQTVALCPVLTNDEEQADVLDAIASRVEVGEPVSLNGLVDDLEMEFSNISGKTLRTRLKKVLSGPVVHNGKVYQIVKIKLKGRKECDAVSCVLDDSPADDFND